MCIRDRDDLMRLFGGERVQAAMERMKIDEDMPIESKMLTRSIQQAQTTVESRNFQARKSVLEYDDVMNKQREIIYGQRRQVLEGMDAVSYTHLRAHETRHDLVCRLLLEKKKKNRQKSRMPSSE